MVLFTRKHVNSFIDFKQCKGIGQTFKYALIDIFIITVARILTVDGDYRQFCA